MIVTGLRKPENEEANEEDKLNVISAAAKEADIDKNDFKKCFDKIHPMGGGGGGGGVGVQKTKTKRE